MLNTKSSYLVVTAVLFGGCSDLLSFDIDRNIEEQVVQGSPVAALLPDTLGVPIPLNIDLEQETEARDTGPVQKVYLSQLGLRVTSTEEPDGDTDDLSFINEAKVYVSSRQAGSTLPRVLVAKLSGVPDGARSLDFEVTGENIKAHVEEGAQIETEASGEAPPDNVSYDGTFTITVEVL